MNNGPDNVGQLVENYINVNYKTDLRLNYLSFKELGDALSFYGHHGFLNPPRTSRERFPWWIFFLFLQNGTTWLKHMMTVKFFVWCLLVWGFLTPVKVSLISPLPSPSRAKPHLFLYPCFSADTGVSPMDISHSWYIKSQLN